MKKILFGAEASLRTAFIKIFVQSFREIYKNNLFSSGGWNTNNIVDRRKRKNDWMVFLVGKFRLPISIR